MAGLMTRLAALSRQRSSQKLNIDVLRTDFLCRRRVSRRVVCWRDSRLRSGGLMTHFALLHISRQRLAALPRDAGYFPALARTGTLIWFVDSGSGISPFGS